MAAPNPMPCPHCSGKKPEASTPAGVGLRAVTPGPALFLMDGTFFNLQFFITTHDLLLHHLRSIISGNLMTCTFGSSNFSRNFTRTVKSSRTHVLLWGHDESEASVAGSGVKFVFFFYTEGRCHWRKKTSFLVCAECREAAGEGRSGRFSRW